MSQQILSLDTICNRKKQEMIEDNEITSMQQHLKMSLYDSQDSKMTTQMKKMKMMCIFFKLHFLLSFFEFQGTTAQCLKITKNVSFLFLFITIFCHENSNTVFTRKQSADFFFFFLPKIADYNRVRIKFECGLFSSKYGI